MIKRIINLIAATSLGLVLFNVVALSTPIYAAAAPGATANYGLFAAGNCNGTQSDCAACDGLNQLNDATCGQGQSKIESFAGDIVRVISIIAGIIAVIMIIIAGIRYTASGGDSNAVGGAKNALVYALIGILIAALAQVLVHFALSATSNS